MGKYCHINSHNAVAENDSNNKQDFRRIRPVSMQPDDTPGSDGHPGAGRKIARQRLWYPGLAALIITVFAVFFWLPDFADQYNLPDRVGSEPQPGRIEQEQTVQPPPSLDPEQILANRKRAEDLSERLHTLRDDLQSRSVFLWAEQSFARNTQTTELGKNQFGARDYIQAAESWQLAIDQAEQLIQQSGHELVSAIERGEQAIAEGDQQQAIRSFELALKIDRGNNRASQGLARAKTLDQVLALLKSARTSEQQGQYKAALVNYEQARELDPAMNDAVEGIKRINRTLAEISYRRHLSSAMAAMEYGEFQQALDEYQNALKIRPESGEAREGVASARDAIKSRAVGIHKANARAYEKSERWARAVAEYEQALKIDPTLTFAQQGLTQARARAKLNESLEYHIENPTRVYDRNVLPLARQLLEQARNTTPTGPRLQQQITALQNIISVATTAIPVELVSDNVTRVMIYHVGKFGSFAKKTLELTPGEYTAVGRRDGYRDVRLTFRVAPDKDRIGPIRVVCTEPV